MKDEVYWTPGPWPGRLGIAARPRGGDWLEGEIREWRRLGFDTVVSLLTKEEVDEFSLQGEESYCRQEGLNFRQLPVPDMGVPASPVALFELVAFLETILQSGRHVIVHCRQGIGRSSLLAASLLVAAGTDSGRAFRVIEEARGRPVPETAEQRRWVEQIASDLHSATHNDRQLGRH